MHVRGDIVDIDTLVTEQHGEVHAPIQRNRAIIRVAENHLFGIPCHFRAEAMEAALLHAGCGIDVVIKGVDTGVDEQLIAWIGVQIEIATRIELCFASPGTECACSFHAEHAKTHILAQREIQYDMLLALAAVQVGEGVIAIHTGVSHRPAGAWLQVIFQVKKALLGLRWQTLMKAIVHARAPVADMRGELPVRVVRLKRQRSVPVEPASGECCMAVSLGRSDGNSDTKPGR